MVKYERQRALKVSKYEVTNPDANKIIDDLGGNVAISKMLNISLPAVTYWRKHGIPVLRLIQINNLMS